MGMDGHGGGACDSLSLHFSHTIVEKRAEAASWAMQKRANDAEQQQRAQLGKAAADASRAEGKRSKELMASERKAWVMRVLKRNHRGPPGSVQLPDSTGCVAGAFRMWQTDLWS